MNSRERVKMALEHRTPDRMPLQLWLVDEVTRQLQAHFKVQTQADVLDQLDVDVRWLLVDYIGPPAPIHGNGEWEDEFGIRFRLVDNQYGTYEEFAFHPLAEAETAADVNNFRWPSLDWWDYGGIERQIVRADRVEPRWLGIGYASLHERAWNLVGFEKWLIELASNPDFVEAVLDRLLEFYLEQTSRILRAAGGRIDMIYVADDLGGQCGLLISPEMWARYLKNRWATYIDTVRSRHGKQLKFHFHSCGAVYDLIPEFIEVGIDILNPIQPRAAGMNAARLKKEFGDRLCFCGGFDIQELLPRGSVEEIRKEATRLAHVLGRHGGYIASAAHAVQADTPLKNLLEMLDAFKTA